MLKLPSLHDRQKVIDAIVAASNPSAEDYEPLDLRLALFLGDTNPEDLTGILTGARWGQDGIPITLDATVSAYLSHRMVDQRVRLLAQIHGIVIPQLTSAKSAITPGSSAYTTNLLASSPGSLLSGQDAIKIGGSTELDWVDQAPHHILWDVLQRMPYDKRLIEIQPLNKMRLTFSKEATSRAGQPFDPSETVGDALSRIASEGNQRNPSANADYEYRDTATGGFVARRAIPLGRGHLGVPEGAYRDYSTKILPNWESSRPSPPLLRYSAVRVSATNDDGRLLYESIYDVPYPEDVARPHQGRTLEIAIDDETPEGPDNATRLASTQARKLASITCEGSGLSLPTYDPLVEIADPLKVTDDRPVNPNDRLAGHWNMRWGMRIESYDHTFGSTSGNEGIINTQVSYTATLLHEDLIKPPALIVP